MSCFNTFLRAWRWLLPAFVMSFAVTAMAEQPRFFNLEGFGNWLDGNPESTAVSEEGEIELPSPSRVRYEDPAATFTAAAAFGDDIVVARVDDGRLLAIDRAGTTRELFRPEERLITALAPSPKGDYLYVAAGPPARIYRLDRAGDLKEHHTPDAAFVWDMVAAPTGTLYAVTGEPGRVIRIDRAGDAGKVLFEPDQEHLRAIAVDATLGLLVGGGERGILYRAPPESETVFRALFDSGHPEITAIVTLGAFAYVAGVTGAQALAAEEGNEQQGTKNAKGPEVRSQLSRVSMDGTAEVLAGSSDEAIFDVAVNDKGQVIVATGASGRDDPRGRLYTIEPAQRLIAMAYQSPSRRITHLINLPRGAMAAVAGGGGRVVHFAGGLAKKGEFLTTPFDTVINSQYGLLQIFADQPAGTRVTAAVRTGQTAKPDESWIDWSPEIAAPGGERALVENGRHMQIRLTLEGDGKATPRVTRVRLAYLRQNLRPFVREVVALNKGLALAPLLQEESKTKNINLDDKAANDQRRKQEKKPTKRARQSEEVGALTVKWVAEDPNGDDLRYDLMMRGPGHPDWHTLEDDLESSFFTFDSSQLPDGHYRFKVLATDAPSNPAGLEQNDTRESQSVLIDNTPPRLDPLAVEIRNGRVTIRTVVADEVGPLTEAVYSLDGGSFVVLAPEDGLLDGPGESFSLRLGDLSAGPHTITVRVMDEGDNAGTGQTSFVVP